ncbi:LysR substrate-binding domain-containing protein [Hyphomicrobium sp. MC1]|uniref:LysR substrate-binding domain-containing protein n=1 Tax=Hyphomicrobium sp. (strain MC1) TaxID=717785 RepID=UPI000213EB75|nr:LysR substrate-binding domain-containing protein [Hyphomicrobium sp. MC1]CCB66624.1 HTH-type transcriptional regulator cbl [Hyphomicrobium sp. MC1]
MNFQQLRILRETIRYKFNITEVANAIYVSQSGVSKQIRELEEELGSSLFIRRGKRLLGLTDLGAQVARIAERVLFEAENIKQAAAQFSTQDKGVLQVATTHTQARYVLPEIIVKFKEKFPDVRLDLRQSNPRDISSLLLASDADIGIATGVFGSNDEIITFPFYSWEHIVIAPAGHPLESKRAVSLYELAQFPLITYESGITGRPHIDEAFEKAGISPNITITALDADVIKAYVEWGLGIGIIAPMAYDENRDHNLRMIDTVKVFSPSMSSIAIRRGRLQRGFVYRFIELCAPQVTEDDIREADLAPHSQTDFLSFSSFADS